MLLRLEAWRVEILADDVHMQLAANTTFNTDLYKKETHYTEDYNRQ